MLNKLREHNQKLIEKYEKANNEKQLTTQNVIKQLLKDDKCFEKMTMEESYKLLKCLGFSNEQCEKAYIKLIEKI